ncbi:RNase H-like domain found in reverse transcriptase [Popillia japonica]|uniref:RNA-directed DNA polymerase n=1 Tax=Popillia japonica TaxID=7064 RepID=A0AAW1KII2_POPJA
MYVFNGVTETVAYGSRSLTATEGRYSQIEKEMLAITAYTFTTHHQKGSSNPADYISRHPIQHTEYEQAKAQAVEEHVKFVATHSIPKAMSLEDVERATKQDAELQKVLKALTTDDNTLWNDLKGYKNIKHEITSENGVVLRNNKIILPKSLQKKAIELAHRGHLGMVKTKQLLRSKVWFPSIDKMVELETEGTELPSAPWENLDIDFAGPYPGGKYLLILIDEHTRYPIVEVISALDAQTVTKKLRHIFD